MGQFINSNITRKRYDRFAFFYDLFELPAEYLRFAGWRIKLLNKLQGGEKILEAGVGT